MKNYLEDTQKYTRDVGDNMLKALKDKNMFAPFVEFVRNNPAYELALCFRGNDSYSDDGRVIIYKNNHKIWDLYLKNGSPKVMVSLNHLRFMENWRDMIKQLMELGFKDLQGRTYSQLEDRKEFVERSKDFGYNAISLEYSPKAEEEINIVVVNSFAILERMQEEFFGPSHTEIFDVYNARSKKTKKEKRPRNFLKDYYFENHEDKRLDDPNQFLYANFQHCEEKHLQQALFLNNHRFRAGLFLYDLEFSQPKIPGENIESQNEPDMFGIRFNDRGEMEAICMVEVKCTWSAFTGKSGIEKHLSGMENYITSSGRLMKDRRNEACHIMNQYYELGLYGVSRRYEEDEFKSLNKEIIFVFTQNYPLDKKLHRNLTIGEALPKFSVYDHVHKGYYPKGIYAVKRVY